MEIQAREHLATFRLAGDGGASTLSVIPMQIRFGPAALTCGGIAGGGTDEAVRNRGLARRVIGAFIEWMCGERLALSWLFGIPNFYEKFGFAPLLPVVTSTFTAEHLATLPATPVSAGVPDSHREFCLALAAERDQGTVGGASATRHGAASARAPAGASRLVYE